MPDIHATAGDLIEVLLYPNGPTPKDSAATAMLAKIMTKSNSGKYEIELAGDPPMRGLIKIDDYEWSPEFRRWVRKPKKELQV